MQSILNDKSPEKARSFVKQSLQKILTNKYGMEKFVVTKTLKGPALVKQERKIEQLKPKDDRSYADRTRIAHAVLADRMADRDPGNRPQSNDRIPYAYVITKDVEVQGDRVEHPEYIAEHKLELDYVFYITNQIMKPAIQFLKLLFPEPEKIFETFIMKELNRRVGKRPLTYYFKLLEELNRATVDDVFGESDNEEEENYDKHKFMIDYDVIKESILKKKPIVKAQDIRVVKDSVLKKKPVVKAQGVKRKCVMKKKIAYDGGFSVDL